MTNAKRAARKSGKKSPSAQSAKTAKTAPGKSPVEPIYIQVIDEDGNVAPEVSIPPRLHRKLLPFIERSKQAALAEPATEVRLYPINVDANHAVTALVKIDGPVF